MREKISYYDSPTVLLLYQFVCGNDHSRRCLNNIIKTYGKKIILEGGMKKTNKHLNHSALKISITSHYNRILTAFCCFLKRYVFIEFCIFWYTVTKCDICLYIFKNLKYTMHISLLKIKLKGLSFYWKKKKTTKNKHLARNTQAEKGLPVLLQIILQLGLPPSIIFQVYLFSINDGFIPN